MKDARGRHLPMTGTEGASPRRRQPATPSRMQQAVTSPVTAVAHQRKPAVLFEMQTIRWLLAMHHFQVDAYSDEAIADALLETCPVPDDFWLRSEHLALAVRRVSATRGA
jgi:hypothetical protein